MCVPSHHIRLGAPKVLFRVFLRERIAHEEEGKMRGASSGRCLGVTSVSVDMQIVGLPRIVQRLRVRALDKLRYFQFVIRELTRVKMLSNSKISECLK